MANNLIPDNVVLDKFWRFVAERHHIWLLRAAMTKPPWTADPVLRNVHFTNVYRELDPGTGYAVALLASKEFEADNREQLLQEKLLNAMVYRLVGREETHAALGWLKVEENEAWRFIEVLQRIRAQGGTPFTGSYMVNSYSSMGTHDKVINVGRLIHKLISNWPDFWSSIVSAQLGGRPKLHEELEKVYGWGGFLAYQVLVDCSYPLPYPLSNAEWTHTGEHSYWNELFRGQIMPAGNDGWVFLGPGARRGVNRLFPDIEDNDVGHNKALIQLAVSQHEELIMLDFPWLRDDTGASIPLTRANLVNCLCEYDKYVRYSGKQASGRRFDDVASYRRDRLALGHEAQLALPEE